MGFCSGMGYWLGGGRLIGGFRSYRGFIIYRLRGSPDAPGHRAPMASGLFGRPAPPRGSPTDLFAMEWRPSATRSRSGSESSVCGPKAPSRPLLSGLTPTPSPHSLGGGASWPPNQPPLTLSGGPTPPSPGMGGKHTRAARIEAKQGLMIFDHRGNFQQGGNSFRE